MTPDQLKYTKDHVWVEVEGDTVRMGITDHAQKELGDIVFVELPEIGRKCVQGMTVGSIESIKTTNDLLAPVTGEVIEVNETVRDKPDTINNEPYGKGWMIRIRISSANELQNLLSFEAYQQVSQG